jgi:hypothetical protein
VTVCSQGFFGSGKRHGTAWTDRLVLQESLKTGQFMHPRQLPAFKDSTIHSPDKLHETITTLSPRFTDFYRCCCPEPNNPAGCGFALSSMSSGWRRRHGLPGQPRRIFTTSVASSGTVSFTRAGWLAPIRGMAARSFSYNIRSLSSYRPYYAPLLPSHPAPHSRDMSWAYFVFWFSRQPQSLHAVGFAILVRLGLPPLRQSFTSHFHISWGKPCTEGGLSVSCAPSCGCPWHSPSATRSN